MMVDEIFRDRRMNVRIIKRIDLLVMIVKLDNPYLNCQHEQVSKNGTP